MNYREDNKKSYLVERVIIFAIYPKLIRTFDVIY